MPNIGTCKRVFRFCNIKIYFFRDSGADLENLRNVFFQKKPISYDHVRMTIAVGDEIASNQEKYMDRTFTCSNTAKTKVN